MTTSKLSPSGATVLVESFRVKLGLLPWHNHAKTCGRGSGKTTRAILEAIAATIEQPGELAVIATMPSSAASRRRRFTRARSLLSTARVGRRVPVVRAKRAQVS